MGSHPSQYAYTTTYRYPPWRPVGLPQLLLAGITLLLSTVGQAYVLLTSSALGSRYPYITSVDMIAIAATLLSIVGGSWLFALSKPSRSIRLDPELKSPLLDTFVNEKRALRIKVKPQRSVDTRATQAVYIPYFIAGNVCLGLWSVLWVAELYITSQIALLTHLIIQNYAIFISLHSWRHPDMRMSSGTWKMHILSKGNAALAVLFLWTNSGILENLSTPSTAEMLNNGTIFILMAVGGGPDPTIGLFLLYDLFALAYGTGAVKEWQIAFQYTALVVLFVLAWDLSGVTTERQESNIEDVLDGDGEIALDLEHHSRHF